jgi:hypothetical protein
MGGLQGLPYRTYHARAYDRGGGEVYYSLSTSPGLEVSIIFLINPSSRTGGSSTNSPISRPLLGQGSGGGGSGLSLHKVSRSSLIPSALDDPRSHHG